MNKIQLRQAVVADTIKKGLFTAPLGQLLFELEAATDKQGLFDIHSYLHSLPYYLHRYQYRHYRFL